MRWNRPTWLAKSVISCFPLIPTEHVWKHVIGIQRARTNQCLNISNLRPISASRVPICDTDKKKKKLTLNHNGRISIIRTFNRFQTEEAIVPFFRASPIHSILKDCVTLALPRPQAFAWRKERDCLQSREAQSHKDTILNIKTTTTTTNTNK